MADAASVDEQSDKIIRDAGQLGMHPDDAALRAKLKEEVAASDPKAVDDAIKDLRGQQGSALSAGATDRANIYKTASEEVERDAAAKGAGAEVRGGNPEPQATSRDTIKPDSETIEVAMSKLAKEAVTTKDEAVRTQDVRELAKLVQENPDLAKEVADRTRHNEPLLVVDDKGQVDRKVNTPENLADFDRKEKEIALIKSLEKPEPTAALGGAAKLEPTAYHPPAEAQDSPSRPEAAARTSTNDTLLKHEIAIDQAAGKVVDANSGQDKAAAEKALEHQVKAAPEAARAFIKNADTTHMDMASIDAMVAVRDALQKSDAANIIKDAMKGDSPQELSRLARTDHGAAEMAIATLKSEGGHEEQLAAIRAAMSGKVQGGAEAKEHSAPIGGAKTQIAGVIQV